MASIWIQPRYMNCCLEAIPIHDELSTSTTAATSCSENQYKHLHYIAWRVLPYPEAPSAAICVTVCCTLCQVLIKFPQECGVVQRHLSADKVWSFSLAFVQPSHELEALCCMHACVGAGRFLYTCCVDRIGRYCGLQREERRGAGLHGQVSDLVQS
jgi:hypothetical protein